MDLEGTDRVVVVGICAHVEINEPCFQCATCKTAERLHPFEWGVMPATPEQPGTFYQLDLLQLAETMLLKADASFDGFSDAVGSLHFRLGLPQRYSDERLWRNLMDSWLHLCAISERIQVQRLGLALRLTGARCAACSRVVRGVVGDCCYGIAHLAKAGRASTEVAPRLSGMFLPDDEVKAGVEAYVAAKGGAEAAHKADSIQCSQHKAVLKGGDAGTIMRRRRGYNRGALGALACIHGQVRASFLPPLPRPCQPRPHAPPTEGRAVSKPQPDS